MAITTFSRWLLVLILSVFIISCTDYEFDDTIEEIDFSDFFREEVIVENNVFKVSYNELYEQPNWIEYEVRDIEKVVDRDGFRFYTEDTVHTSNDFDYIDNIWDRGHLAPAAAFTDSYDNLNTTFSYLNCALQVDKLNGGAWVELETQNRLWAKEYGTLKVRIELEFAEGHIVLPTYAHVPTGFYKMITFPDSTIKCYFFPNEVPNQIWQNYEISCN